MNIPMEERINENTNAAAEAVKAAILAAMPAAGIDQAALDAAVDEILAAMPTTSTSSAQTKKFTTVKQGAANSNGITVTGSGYAIIYPENNDGTIIIDGVSFSGYPSDILYHVYFEQKIVLKGVSSSYPVRYIIWT